MRRTLVPVPHPFPFPFPHDLAPEPSLFAQQMRQVVQIHNTVNERAWKEVLWWEQQHGGACACEEGPRLAKFIGRPDEPSPKARIKTLLGYTAPFDRHDWTVDRCGKQVRYVVDFYTGQPQQQRAYERNADSPPEAPVTMYLDVRPALDSFDAAWSRVRMWWSGKTKPTPADLANLQWGRRRRQADAAEVAKQ